MPDKPCAIQQGIQITEIEADSLTFCYRIITVRGNKAKHCINDRCYRSIIKGIDQVTRIDGNIFESGRYYHCCVVPGFDGKRKINGRFILLEVLRIAFGRLYGGMSALNLRGHGHEYFPEFLFGEAISNQFSTSIKYAVHICLGAVPI